MKFGFFPKNNENNFYYQPILSIWLTSRLPDDIHMMEQAVAVRKKAYAPYSKFRVAQLSC
jgi:hypothetical protein